MACVVVVIPTFERHDLLEEAVASLRAQTFGDWEAVIVDGSKAPWQRLPDDSRVRYFRESDHGISGVAAARNFAMHNSDSSYIAFLDDDEVFYPTKLEVMYNHLERETDAEFAYHDVVVSCIEKTPSGYRHVAVPRRHWHPDGDPNRMIYEAMFIAGLQVVHTRRLFEVTGGFREYADSGLYRGAYRSPESRYDEDADYFRRCAAHTTLSRLPLQLAEYRVHGGNANHWGIDYDQVVAAGRLEKEFY